MTEDSGTYLRTRYVFIDTQAFRRERFNWRGPTLSKLTEFAQQGHLCLLVTDVTLGEVKSQLRELISEASASLKKHSGILDQLGAFQAVQAVQDETTAARTLEDAFDEFLNSTKAIHVPTVTEVEGVLNDYFARRPPFSSKKKAEFPDAISIASVRLWCERNNSSVYVVSEDSDLRDCCAESSSFMYSSSIKEIISQATVSRGLHSALTRALRASDSLNDQLAEAIKNTEVNTERYSLVFGIGTEILGAKIERVESLTISEVNVLEQFEQHFRCELEIRADVTLDIEVEVEVGYRYGTDTGDYEPPRHHSLQQSRTHFFFSEIGVRFDAQTSDLDVEWTHMGSHDLYVSLDNTALY